VDHPRRAPAPEALAGAHLLSSEISKSLVDAVLYGAIYVNKFDEDMALVDEIFRKEYSSRIYQNHRVGDSNAPTRSLLSAERSLGSVIKLLTPNPAEFTPEHNTWLKSIPNYIRAIVFIIKRFYRQEWGDDWLLHFSVDIVNGVDGHELKYDGRKLVGSYLRVGLDANGAWRTYKLRQDFLAADKVQMEDDITASVVVSRDKLVGLPKEYDGHPSLKLSENCEYRLFSGLTTRPPRRGPQTERDMADPGLFCSNFQLLGVDDVRDIAEDVALQGAFTEPMRTHIGRRSASELLHLLGQAARRRRQPTKNPRYLQVRPTSPRLATATWPKRARGLPAAAHRPAGRLPVISVPRAAQQPARRRHPPALRVQPHPLPGAARALHGLHLLADRKSPSTTAPVGGRVSPRVRSTPSARDGGPQQRAWSRCCFAAMAASAPPRASAPTTGSITTSAFSSPRSGAVFFRTIGTRRS
jgi:hypothetical protein